MCMRAYQGKCPQLLFFSESGWRYPGLRQHRHRIFFPKQIWIKICLWGKNCTRNSDIMNIQATSVQYLQYTLITANPSHVYIRSDHTRAGLEISSCTAGLLLVSCLKKMMKKHIVLLSNKWGVTDISKILPERLIGWRGCVEMLPASPDLQEAFNLDHVFVIVI